MFFFKPSVITVDAFTAEPHAHAYAPIAPASKFIPQWWKDLDATFPMPTNSGIEVQGSTMKSCRGFIDLYRHGFILPIWSDFILQMAADGSWRSQWSDVLSQSMVSMHPAAQFTGLPGSNVHIKFTSPWILNEKSGVEFMFMQPSWSNPDPDFRIMPGVVNYKHQHSTNINALVTPREGQFQLNHGDPLVHLVPITDKRVQLKCHLVSREEFQAMMDFSGRSITFRNVYKSRKQALEKNQEAVCPFHKFKSTSMKFDGTSSTGPK